MPSAHLSGKIGQPTSPVPRLGASDAVPLASSSGGFGGAAGSGGMSQDGGGGGDGLSPAPPGPPEDPSKFAFYNIKRYRGLFNVDTADVLTRLMHAVVLFFRGCVGGAGRGCGVCGGGAGSVAIAYLVMQTLTTAASASSPHPHPPAAHCLPSPQRLP